MDVEGQITDILVMSAFKKFGTKVKLTNLIKSSRRKRKEVDVYELSFNWFNSIPLACIYILNVKVILSFNIYFIKYKSDIYQIINILAK